MSLRTRLGLAIAGLVLALVLASWAAGGAVLRPLHKQLQNTMAQEAETIAEAVEKGQRLEDLERIYNVDLELKRRPPPPPGWREVRDTKRTTWVGRKGRHTGMAVETDRGWVIVHREVDLQRPRKMLPLLLLLVGVAVGGVALWVGFAAVRPIEQATEAMGRVAEGDLSHRLASVGPPELQRVAHSFNAMADRIDSMLRAEKEMFAGLSHDLRTPLTRLRLEVELLRDSGVSEKRVGAMENDLAEIEGLIASMLEFSRLGLGHHILKVQEVDLAALAAEAARGQAPVTGTGKAQADSDLVIRAVRNLVENAIRYGERPSISVQEATVVVRDHGPGVPPEQLKRLFEPFYRGDRSRSSQGHGLGLMIVAQVARLHGGKVSARNHPEGGLEVSLSLGPPPAPS